MQFVNNTAPVHTHADAANGGTLNASAITAGTMGTARLGSGSASDSTYLRGDSTWQAIAGVTDHGALTGLSDDDHSIYALLTGRAAGQSIALGVKATAPAAGVLIEGIASSTGGVDFTVQNTNNGTAALAEVRVGNDASHYCEIGVTSTGYTYGGVAASEEGFVVAESTLNGLVLAANGASGTIRFAIAGANKGGFTGHRLQIGGTIASKTMSGTGIDIHGAGNFMEFKAGGTDAWCYTYYSSSRGSIASPTASGSGDILGSIMGRGYQNSAYRETATIRFVCDAAPTGNLVPSRIIMQTSNGSVAETERFRLDQNGNLGLGVTSFGTNAVGVLSVGNFTAPTTGPADTVQFYSSDNSAGNTIPSFFCEGTEVIATGQADSVSSVRVKMRVNGTVVTLLGI